MSTGNGAILVTRDLHKTYEMGTSEVHVLKGIDLVIDKGQVVAIIGPSGVGKSTLLHIMGTLDRPTKGRVEIDGTDVFSFDNRKLARFRNKRIGFVFQFHHLLPEFTALENVMMPGLIAGFSRNQVVDRARKLLQDVGLGARLQHRPNELSGGELQRVAVARALMNNPMIVLADEPSGNLDQTTSKSLHKLLWDLSRKLGKTFVIVTHNTELAENADKVVELSDGRIKREQLRQIV